MSNLIDNLSKLTNEQLTEIKNRIVTRKNNNGGTNLKNEGLINNKSNNYNDKKQSYINAQNQFFNSNESNISNKQTMKSNNNNNNNNKHVTNIKLVNELLDDISKTINREGVRYFNKSFDNNVSRFNQLYSIHADGVYPNNEENDEFAGFYVDVLLGNDELSDKLVFNKLKEIMKSKFITEDAKYDLYDRITSFIDVDKLKNNDNNKFKGESSKNINSLNDSVDKSKVEESINQFEKQTPLNNNRANKVNEHREVSNVVDNNNVKIKYVTSKPTLTINEAQPSKISYSKDKKEATIKPPTYKAKITFK